MTVRYVLLYESADDVAGRAPASFPAREAAEAFVAGDPFVLNHVIRSYQIREWNDILS
jgi:uncharacterized protein YciI